MKKLNKTKKLALATQTITNLTADDLAQVIGGMRLTRPYTKVSLCAEGSPCGSEVC